MRTNFVMKEAFLALGMFILLWGWHSSRPQELQSAYLETQHLQTKSTSGVTGSLFTGNIIRHFGGPLLFQGEEIFRPKKEDKLKQEETVKHAKWAVCTTIHSPTQAILDFVDSNDWAIVIIGDEGMAPFHVHGKNTAFLDVSAQQALKSDFGDLLALLPWKHFGRKNIGYLYAILHGAEEIWDFDDDNFMKEGRLPEIRKEGWKGHRLLLSEDNNCLAFNPLPLMGDESEPTSMWPRGFPLNLLRDNAGCDYSLVTEEDFSTVAVYQSLADVEPDVDGIYRLTRVTPLTFSTTKVDTNKLMLPHGTLSPYNAQATLFTKPAFWSLLLPVSVHGRVSDIWRSYIAQRLLWDIGLNIAFVSPLVDQHRNVHNPLADMKAEEDLYFKSLELVKFLTSWQGRTDTLVGRYEELVVALYERDYLGENDVLLAQQWLLALDRAGYEVPALASKAFVPSLQTAPLSCPTETRVLVTGISGMIGSHVARVLVNRECYKLYGLVRPRSNLDTLVGVIDRITMVTGDITDGPRMSNILEEIRPHYIYHFAAQAINGISYDLPELTLDTNVIGTMNILEAVRKLGLSPRILLAGSSTEYGHTADQWNGRPIPEDAPLDPVSPYGVSKLTMEKLGNQYAMSFGLQVITARFFIQVGVGGTDSLAIHQFCKQIALAEAGVSEPVVQHGNLETARDMTDCRDSAPIVVELAEKGEVGEAYNIGSGHSMTMQTLLELAISQSKIPIKPVADRTRLRVYDEKVLLADIAKVRELTGWVPNTNMHETITSILDYWRQRVQALYGAEKSR